MQIDKIHSFLTYPAKHLEEQPTIRGTEVPLQGRLFQMLTDIFKKADVECNIEIIFEPDEEGRQHNICRDLIIAYITDPTVANGSSIAARLQSVTTHRSGLGLLFLMKGMRHDYHRLVISRFPADRGILAHEDAQTFSIEFIERVFMKSATAYKSALFMDHSLIGDFWVGKAIDRQINRTLELSNYWIREFLLSDFITTGDAGTRRLAIALRDAVKNAPSLEAKEELLSVTRAC